MQNIAHLEVSLELIRQWLQIPPGVEIYTVKFEPHALHFMLMHPFFKEGATLTPTYTTNADGSIDADWSL